MVYIAEKDFYEIRFASLITNVDKDSLLELYQPIIGAQATILYLTLLKQKRNADGGTIFKMDQLINTMQLTSSELIDARHYLEAVGLVRTYESKTEDIRCYIYVIYSPKSPKAFFDDVLFKGLLIQSIGEKEAKRLANKYKVNLEIPNDYSEISASFVDVYKIDYDDPSFKKDFGNKIIGRNHGRANINFNYDLFFKYITENWGDFYDGHLLLSTQKESFSLPKKETSYYSNLIFKKEDNNVFLFNTENQNVNTNVIYLDDINKLHPFYYDDELLYRVILFQKENMDEKFDIITNTGPLRMTLETYSPYQNTNTGPVDINMLETSKSLYIYIANEDFHMDNEEFLYEEQTKLTKLLKDICHCKPEKNIILDFRGNYGGNYSLLELLLTSVFYHTVNDDAYFYYPVRQKAYEGTKKVQDPATKPKKSREKVNVKEIISEEFPQAGYEKLKGNLIILMDQITASAAEMFIANSFLINKEKVVLVGTDSSGCIESGLVKTFMLTNSKIRITLSQENYSNTIAFKGNDHWHGDGVGFYPDYWCDNENLLNTVIQLTKDYELENVLKNLSNGPIIKVE